MGGQHLGGVNPILVADLDVWLDVGDWLGRDMIVRADRDWHGWSPAALFGTEWVVPVWGLTFLVRILSSWHDHEGDSDSSSLAKNIEIVEINP